MDTNTDTDTGGVSFFFDFFEERGDGGEREGMDDFGGRERRDKLRMIWMWVDDTLDRYIAILGLIRCK